MRLAVICALLASALLAVLPAGRAAAGDHMPLLGCGAVPGDTTQTAFTVLINNRVFPPVYATEIVPFALDGYPPVPILGVDCPTGYSAVPDSIPGAFLVTDTSYVGYAGPFVLRVRAKVAPFEIRYWYDGYQYGPEVGLEWNVETCTGAPTPALSASWGRVKSLYR